MHVVSHVSLYIIEEQLLQVLKHSIVESKPDSIAYISYFIQPKNALLVSSCSPLRSQIILLEAD